MVLVCCTSLQQGYLQSLKKHTPVLYDLRWKKKKYDKKLPHPLRTRSHTVNAIIKGFNRVIQYSIQQVLQISYNCTF